MVETRRPSQSLSRRQALHRLAGVAALSAAGLPLLLQACAPAPAAAPTAVAAGGAGVQPAYIPFKGPAPDLPATAQGVQAAYVSYPRTPVKSVPQPPLKGGEVTGYISTVSAPPPPMDQNPAWQEVNRQIGGTLNLTISSSADYPVKLNTLIAGNDIPELIYINPATHNVANQLAFLQAKMADLTPYLAGDAVKDYPNLANFPPYAWQGPGTIYGHQIWGVPDPRPIIASALMVHQEALDQAGVELPRSADDFKRILMAVTRPSANVYGIGGSSIAAFNVAGIFAQVFGAPNNWALDSKTGKLTKMFETDAFKAAVGYTRDLYQAGVFHPNTATNTNTASDQDFSAGNVVFAWATWTGFSTVYWPTALRINPQAKLRAVAPFSADGKFAAQMYLGSGNFGNVHLRSSSPDRVKELLAVCNFLAAPFGSQEQMLLSYGLPGQDYNLDEQGNPITTQNGFATRPVPWRFFTQYPSVIYNTTNAADFAKAAHDGEVAMVPLGVQDPTLNLYSPTAANLNATLQSDFLSAMTDIIAGRRPVGDLAQAVTDWRSKGGDRIRADYEQALAASKA